MFYEDKDGNRVRGVLDDTDGTGADTADLPNRVFRRATSPVVSILRLSSNIISELPPKNINTPAQAVLSSPVMSRRHAVIEFQGDDRVCPLSEPFKYFVMLIETPLIFSLRLR